MALKVLTALDVARTQWYHFTAIFIAGMGFFADAYDFFCIPPVSNLLGRLYYSKCPDPNNIQGTLHYSECPPPYNGSLPLHVKASVNGIALCGAFAGQLFFGWLGDRMGRKKAYGITLMLMVASSIASGFSIGSSPESVITSLCFFRFWLGVGIGGDYPLSATIMSEYANTRTRGAFIAAVFGIQGFGILAGSTVAIIVSACFRAAFPNPTFVQQDWVWRIILMFGAVPAIFTYYWRMKMPETARYTALVARNAHQAAADMSRVLDVDIKEDEESVLRIESRGPPFGLISKSFAKLHGLNLLGTASTWFFVDIAFYSSNLFQDDIYKEVGWLDPEVEKYKINPVEEVYDSARAQALIALCGSLPGYLFAVWFIDRIGRFKIQLAGFFFMAVFLFALAIPYNYWHERSHRHGFLALYSLTFFFSNFGPNTTTFIVPAELFPARLRSTCHGISAAAGKLGAIIGAFGFLYAAKHPSGIGIGKALILLGVASCLGFFCTFLVPETKHRSLEDNEVELVPPLSEHGSRWTEDDIAM